MNILAAIKREERKLEKQLVLVIFGGSLGLSFACALSAGRSASLLRDRG
jgi:hypothetical protein